MHGEPRRYDDAEDPPRGAHGDRGTPRGALTSARRAGGAWNHGGEGGRTPLEAAGLSE